MMERTLKRRRRRKKKKKKKKEDVEEEEDEEGDGINGKGEKVSRVKKPPPLVFASTRQRLNIANAIGGKSR